MSTYEIKRITGKEDDVLKQAVKLGKEGFKLVNWYPSFTKENEITALIQKEKL